MNFSRALVLVTFLRNGVKKWGRSRINSLPDLSPSRCTRPLLHGGGELDHSALLGHSPGAFAPLSVGHLHPIKPLPWSSDDGRAIAVEKGRDGSDFRAGREPDRNDVQLGRRRRKPNVTPYIPPSEQNGEDAGLKQAHQGSHTRRPSERARRPSRWGDPPPKPQTAPRGHPPPPVWRG